MPLRIALRHASSSQLVIGLEVVEVVEVVEVAEVVKMVGLGAVKLL